jgi:hypothetical protein
MHAAYAIAPPHPHHPAVELTVRRAETSDDELETKYIYVLSDGTGAVRYAGYTKNLRRRETTHRHSHRRPDQSPLTRHLAEAGGFDGWNLHLYAIVTYDAVRCHSAVARAEDDAIAALRAEGCELLNKNNARAPRAMADAQRAWRERNGQGTEDSYMATYCRAWRARKATEAADAAAAAEAMAAPTAAPVGMEIEHIAAPA